MPNATEKLVSLLTPHADVDWVNDDMALIDYRAGRFILKRIQGMSWAVYEKGYGRVYETDEGWLKCVDWIERNRY